jgi:pSer/pThr/pTyr-binding forkhead associated (FHA) protein
MIVLVPVDDDGEDGAPLRFGQPQIHVGHGSHNDLILDEEDQGTSYEHALITVLHGRAVVVCEPTAKPTYIDGADISYAPEEERQLKPGDIISFGKGKSIFRVLQIGAATDAPEPAHEQVRVHVRTAKRKQGARRANDIPPLPRQTENDRQDRGLRPVTFQVYKGDELVREETLCQPLIRIGRMRSSHLLLDDESVSRTHAVVEVTAEQEVLLIDLDSSSGTAVNGARVKKAVLKSGDELEFGKARVIVRYGEAVENAAAIPPAPAIAESHARPRSVSPPPIPSEPGFGPSHTEVLSEGEWEVLESPRLVVRRDGEKQGEFVLTKPHTTIGRLPENDVQLDDGAVSGKHALLVAETGVFLILDQRSTNGTFLNGKKCSGEALRNGDVIQIGRFELVFSAPGPVITQKPPGTEVLSPEAAAAIFAKVGGRRGKNK